MPENKTVPTLQKADDDILNSQRWITLGGKRLLARPVSMGDFADFESFIRGRQAHDFMTLMLDKRMSTIQQATSRLNANTKVEALTIAGIVGNLAGELDKLVSSTIGSLYNRPMAADEKANHAQSFTGVLYFLWRAVHACNPDITYEDIGEMISENGIQAAMTQLDAIRGDVADPQKTTGE